MIIEPYPYQKEAIEAVQEAEVRGLWRQLIYMATGTGKTFLAAMIHKALGGGKVLFLAHRKKLLEQTISAFYTVSPEAGRPGLVQGPNNELGRQITVASTATLYHEKRLQQVVDNGPYSLLFWDECHHIPSAANVKVRERLPCGLFIGLTATPERADGKGLEPYFDDIVYRYSLSRGIAEGYLAPLDPLITRRVSVINLGDVSVGRGGDYNEGGLSKVMNTPKVRKIAVETWLEYAEKRQTLGFCVDIQHAQDMAREFREHGVSAECVHHGLPEKEEERILAAHSSGEINVLLNPVKLTEGYDDPEIRCLVDLRPSQSQALVIQSMGRGTRRAPGKDGCMVISLTGNDDRHLYEQLGLLAGREIEISEDGEVLEEEEQRGEVAGEDDDQDREASVGKVVKKKIGGVRELKYVWVKEGEVWALSLGDKKLGMLFIRPDHDNPGNFHVYHYKQDGWQDKLKRLTEESFPLDFCTKAAEQSASRFLGRRSEWREQAAGWRNEHATSDQREAVRRITKKDPHQWLSRGDAEEIITSRIVRDTIKGLDPEPDQSKRRWVLRNKLHDFLRQAGIEPREVNWQDLTKNETRRLFGIAKKQEERENGRQQGLGF